MNELALLLIKNSLFTKVKRRIRFDYVIMILGIVVSVAVVATAINLFEGYEKTLKKILLSSSAHIMVYSEYGQTLSKEQSERAIEQSKERREISSVRAAYTNTAMLRKDGKIRSCLVRAYSPEADNETWYAHYLRQGKSSLVSGNVILGDILAGDLGLNINDSITLLYPQTETFSPLGMIPRQMDFTIAGIVKTGYYEMDKTLILMTTDDAFSFYNIAPQYTHLEINLKEKWINQAEAVKAKLQSILGKDFLLHSWIDYNGNLFSLIVIEKWLIFLVFSFLILIAALNSISIVSTSILDKKREIAILKTVGLAVRQIRQVVYLRILFICVVSIVVGLALGSVISWLITQQSFYQLKGEVYFIDKITMHISALNYLAVFILSLLMIAICIKLPLRYIDRMNIIDVLRGN
ncbi:MAG: FtsX-like permease family protein [Candidatus Cloacimonadaceae bacterium]